MPPKVLHQPRVAWDFARVLVDLALADDELFRWFGSRMAELLGERFCEDLYQTRVRLAAQTDRRMVEIGTWRVRIEDALRFQADLVEDLRSLGLDASSRLAAGGRVRGGLATQG